jgi:hypothetical protein
LFDDGSGYLPKKSLSLGKISRVNRYYPSRKTSAYADFDRRTFVARLGMVNEMQADKEVGVTVEGLPPVLRFQTKVSGAPKKIDKNSVLGVRVDFQVGDAYAKSTLFYGSSNGVALYDAARDQHMPFGTQRQADEVVPVGDFSDFAVRLADHAPPGATGRVQLTYLMQDTGTGSRAVITTTSADSPSNPGGGGGAAAAGAASGNGGASSAAGTTGVGGAANGAGGAANGGAWATAGAPGGGVIGAGAPSGAESSCGCRLPRRVSRMSEWLSWLVAGAAWVGLRRRRRS